MFCRLFDVVFCAMSAGSCLRIIGEWSSVSWMWRSTSADHI